MNEKFKELGPLLERAGITKGEASEIFRTSRPTIYTWCEGHGPTQMIVQDAALRVMCAIGKACDAGALPLIDVEKDERVKLLRGVLRTHLNSGK